MGSNNSKKDTAKMPPSKPKTMKYERQFSSEQARVAQNTMYSDYRQNTLDLEDQKKLSTIKDEEKPESNPSNGSNPSDASNNSSVDKITPERLNINKGKPDVLDPKKYKPPPSPAINDSVLNQAIVNDTENVFVKRKESIKEEDEEEEEEMTDAQLLQIKQNTERALSPGINLWLETDERVKSENKTDLDIDDNKNQNQHQHQQTDTIDIPSADNLIKQRSNHDRIASNDDIQVINNKQMPLLWGYCELTRKQLDEDQAAFLTWTHPTDGFVHSWAIFDGHGGYETALYSAQHFLKYVQKYHLTRKKMDISKWPVLLKEIFIKFDEHIGNLNIRGGSTVVVVLLIGTAIICANAGDARAIMSSQNGKAVELSFDHTPMDDYQRLVKIAKLKENYKKINKFFRINPKNETYSDIQKLSPSEMKKAPFISREQDKSRLLGTIGVARGFGDYSLTVFGFRSIKLKPYLSAEPFVIIKELKEMDIEDTDIMCIACDGVFDVMTNQEVIDILRKEIFYRKPKVINKDNNNNNKENKKSVYLQESNLNIDSTQIDRSCGFLGLRSYAKGTMDDVTIFAVPLKQIFEFNKMNKRGFL